MSENIYKHFGIVARHGIYDETTGLLATYGKGQAKKLGIKLKDYLGFLFDIGNTIIISSPLPRAQEYAQIIATQFGVTKIDAECLGYPEGKEHYSGYVYSPEYIGSQIAPFLSYPVILLITHQEYTDGDVPQLFVPPKKRLYHSHFPQLGKGQAHVIDRDTGKAEIF